MCSISLSDIKARKQSGIHTENCDQKINKTRVGTANEQLLRQAFITQNVVKINHTQTWLCVVLTEEFCIQGISWFQQIPLIKLVTFSTRDCIKTALVFQQSSTTKSKVFVAFMYFATMHRCFCMLMLIKTGTHNADWSIFCSTGDLCSTIFSI